MLRSLESLRRRDSRLLAGALAAQAIVAGIALGFLASLPVGGPFSLGLLVAGTIVVAVGSAFAALLEWQREMVAEAFALAAMAGGFALSLATGTTGLWYVAPWEAIASIVVAFALVERYMTRNEERHKPLPGP